MSSRLVPLSVACALFLAGCSSTSTVVSSSTGTSSAVVTGPATSSTSAPTTGAPAGGPTSSTASGDDDHITMAFAGDVHFERQLAPLLRDSDAEWATRMPELAAADFAMVNLETAITERGSRADKTYTFRTSPRALSVLKAAGVDAVSMANNHAADFGDTGIQDTLAAIGSSPIPVVGFGKDENAAYTPATVDVKGVKVGLIASMEVPEETYRNHSAGPGKPGVAQNVERDRFTQEAREAVANHDLVIAFLHWGTEGSTCPNERQVETARILEEAGVDVIVGTHAHRPQGAGWKGRAFVGYGTGNHVWYNTSSLGSRSSGVLTLTVDAAAVRGRGGDRSATTSAVTDYRWIPKVITPSGIPETPTSSRVLLDRAAVAARECSGLAQSRG